MNNPPALDTPLKFLPGVGPARAELLAKELELLTFNDLLHFFPFRYVDRSRFYKVRDLMMASAEVQLKGQIHGFEEKGTGNKKRLTALFEDETGILELVWFKNYKWVKRQIKENEEYVIYGKINWFGDRISMPHPEIEKAEVFKKRGHLGLMPVYPSTEKLIKKGITQKVMQKLVYELFKQVGRNFPETLPEDFKNQNKLIDRSQALYAIHFPKDLNQLAQAQYRLKFEELFYLQLQYVYKNRLRKKKIKGHIFENIGPYFNTFYHEVLDFELTGAQKRVIKEIRKDVKSGAQMNRLLQGDVGSGKTVVAMMSMLMAIDNGFQTALLAPTEILATQHYKTISRWAEKLGLNVSLLTGSTKQKERKIIHQALEDGSLDILIGTHAILEDKVKFKNLGLAVIDEQHRFGVAQRAKMWKKNDIPPHILIMTATPIPRTLSLTHYGDLDVSIIDELPPGRKPVKTMHVYEKEKNKVYHFIRNQINKGRQAYIVYPLIEESEALDYRNLTDGYEEIKEEFLHDGYKIGIVYGKMPAEDKNRVMKKFKDGELDILVSTTVIEVGVDVPNATVMVIESAHRFGLSQLHQLRGRVGRGAEESYCILVTDYKLTDDAKTRIQTMVSTQDGFKIAEVDLRLRGPGDILGTQQSGLIKFKIADLIKDRHILLRARLAAERLLESDPSLSAPQNRTVALVLADLFKKKGFWNYIG